MKKEGLEKLIPTSNVKGKRMSWREYVNSDGVVRRIVSTATTQKGRLKCLRNIMRKEGLYILTFTGI